MNFIEALKYLTGGFPVHSDIGIVILSLPASVPLEYLSQEWTVVPELVFITNGNYYRNYTDALSAPDGKDIYRVRGTPERMDPNTASPFDTEDNDSIDASATQARDENIIWGT